MKKNLVKSVMVAVLALSSLTSVNAATVSAPAKVTQQKKTLNYDMIYYLATTYGEVFIDYGFTNNMAWYDYNTNAITISMVMPYYTNEMKTALTCYPDDLVRDLRRENMPSVKVTVIVNDQNGNLVWLYRENDSVVYDNLPVQ